MEHYYVEGIYLPQRKGKRAEVEMEPFARSFWAASPEEALQLAMEALGGGNWVDPPRVGQVSEEKRMRSSGAPELPGFS